MDLNKNFPSYSLNKLSSITKEHPIYKKWNAFRRFHSQRDKRIYYFDWMLLYEKFGSNPCCYLTSISVDLQDPTSYSLDHIIPRSRGGNCSIDNCGLLSKVGNMLKGDLTLNELDELIKKILNNRINWINLKVAGDNGNAPLLSVPKTDVQTSTLIPY